MAGGRPTIYTIEHNVKALEYLNGGYKGELIDASNKELGYTGEPYPTIAGLSLYLGISRMTVYAWQEDEDKAEFSYIVESLMSTQEVKLTRGGILGEFNPTITKLALTKHGYSDKQDNTHTGSNGGPISLSDMTEEQLDKKLSELVQATNGAE